MGSLIAAALATDRTALGLQAEARNKGLAKCALEAAWDVESSLRRGLQAAARDQSAPMTSHLAFKSYGLATLPPPSSNLNRPDSRSAPTHQVRTTSCTSPIKKQSRFRRLRSPKVVQTPVSSAPITSCLVHRLLATLKHQA